MMNTKYLEFRKKRELGNIVSDTFIFLRRNAKPLFTVLLRTCIIPFIVLILAVGFYTKATSGASFITGFVSGGDISSFLLGLIALMVTGIIYNAMLYGSTSEYIKAYIKDQEQPDTAEVVKNIKNKTGNFIGLGLLNLVIVIAIALIPAGIGVFLFSSGSEGLGVLIVIMAIFPILYVYIKLAVIFPVLSNKELSVSETLKESWRLLKEEWWMTFITIIVLGLLIGVIGFIFQIPALIYTMIKTFTAVQSGSIGDPAAMFDGVYIALQTIASSINYILYVILAIAINFIYFNLNERKNQSGTLDQIDQIGTTNA